MLIDIKNYENIIDVMPCIDIDGRYMIMIGFDNYDSLAYSFDSKERFLSSYRKLVGNGRVL